MKLNLARIERICLQFTVGIPLFAILVCLAVQGGFVTIGARGLALLCMGLTAAWCIFVPRLASFQHVALFGLGVVWSGLIFALDRYGFTDLAPLMQVGPQAILFGVALSLAREETGQDAA